MKNIKHAALILGLVYLPTSMAFPEYHLSGYLSAAGAVSDAGQVWAPILNTSTLPTNAASETAPTFVNTLTHPEIETYNSKPDFQQDSLVGLHGDLTFNDQFSMSVEVAAKGENNWELDTELAYLKYQLNDNWFARAGRLRVPVFMYSENIEVGYDHVWIRLPLEVYALDPHTNYSGADVNYKGIIGGQTLGAQLYYGSLDDNFSGFYQAQTLRYRQMIGANFTVSNDFVKLRAGYNEANLSWVPASGFAQALQAYATALQPTAVSDFDFNGTKVAYTDLGAIFNYANLQLQGEWIKQDSNSAGVAVQKAWYSTLSYRLGDVTPYIGYSALKTTDKNRRNYSGTFGTNVNQILAAINQDQETYTAGLRYDIAQNTAIKFQVDNIKAVHNTAGLFNVYPNNDVRLYSATIDIVY